MALDINRTNQRSDPKPKSPKIPKLEKLEKEKDWNNRKRLEDNSDDRYEKFTTPLKDL